MADFTAGQVLTAAQLDTALNTFTINPQTGTTYTLGAADAGELVTVNNNSGGTVTIPLNATTPYETGTHIAIMNAGTAGTFTVAGAGGVTLNADVTTLTSKKAATLVKTATNTWYLLPFSSGSAPATVTGTTGSPTVDTSSRPGKTIYTFTATGTLTTGTGGTVEALIVGGAGGAGGYGGSSNNSGGGGAGGYLYLPIVELAASTTYTVTVGGGGPGGSGAADGSTGNQSRFGALVAGPGGGGGYGNANATSGASGGGAGRSGGGSKTGGAANFGDVQGFKGGDSNSGAFAAGGGGAGGAGTDNPSGYNGAGGPGLASTITGASVTRAAGGIGARAAGSLAGSANTGNGGASGDGITAGGAGGSGVVIIVVG